MRKILIITLIVLLLVLGYFTIFQGLNIAGLEVLSVFQIKDRSEQLDTELQKVSTLTSVDRPKAMNDLNDSAKQLVIAKEEYNDKILYSSEEEIEQATQGVQYEMEYLWTKIGNHATKNGIVLKFTVTQSSSGAQGLYDLSFVATGKYVSLSEFIASLENDSSLNFKIENAKVMPFEGSTENLQATFTVKEISINIDQVTSSKLNTDNELGTQNNTVSNTNQVIDEGGNP
ncbi:MAG: hypothetical protein J6A04_01405 [Clostridia bacterium]|nr:hypothetical protein [Clostridia bacterium]